MREKILINDGWMFLKDTREVPSHMPAEGERVTLPHTWNAQDGQDGGNDYFRGTCAYVRNIYRSELPKGEIYYLEINGANSSADVYVNGKRLAHHDGGYSTFRVNITAALRSENCIVILVDNSENEYVYPQMADFTFYGGLYRDVSIIAVAATHISLYEDGASGVRITPTVDGKCAKVNLEARVEGMTEKDTVRYVISDANGETVCEKEGDITDCELSIDNVHLWHGRRDPYLYTARVSVIRGGKIVDAVSVRFGCRSFDIDAERGFILNGEEYPLRGVSRHQDRLGIGNALLPEHHREDMDLIAEVGANTIRLAHYQHDQYFYDLCDEYGMVVWAEIPYISRHMSSGNDNAESQMRELIAQCYNHPSIAVWGLSNEITMDGASDPDLIREHERLNNLVHAMDKTRKTVIACLSICSIREKYVHIPDVVAYNHYFGWYGGSYEEYGAWFDNFHKEYPDTPIGISEYGCEALNWHNSEPEAGDYSEEYQALYHESLIKQLFSRKYIWGTYVWNMFDFGADARAEGGENGQNHKGLVTFDRAYKKDAFYAYKAWLSDEPFVHICGKRYVDRTEEITQVTVYSNLPTVELFANGKSLGKRSSDDRFFKFMVQNSGVTELAAVADKCRDESRIRKVDEPNPDYILREQGAVLNWFDITTPDGRFSLNDKIGEITRTLSGKLWFTGLLLTLSRKQRASRKKGSAPRMSAKPSGSLMKMLSSFSVLRFTSMLTMMNVHFTKEELLKMNKHLNKIRKPKKR